MFELSYLIKLILYLAAAYIVGSIPFGYLLARALGKDITKEGSGNIGATNVARVLGPLPGAFVLLLDALKGAFSVVLAGYFFAGGPSQIIHSNQIPKEALLGAAFSVAGHSYSLFLKLRGGKGVATALGAVLFLFPQPVLCGVLTFLLLVLLVRVVSIASLMGTAVVAFGVLVDSGQSIESKIFVLLAALLIYYRHSSNIVRIFSGTENIFRLGGRS